MFDKRATQVANVRDYPTDRLILEVLRTEGDVDELLHRIALSEVPLGAVDHRKPIVIKRSNQNPGQSTILAIPSSFVSNSPHATFIPTPEGWTLRVDGGSGTAFMRLVRLGGVSDLRRGDEVPIQVGDKFFPHGTDELRIAINLGPKSRTLFDPALDDYRIDGRWVKWGQGIRARQVLDCMYRSARNPGSNQISWPTLLTAYDGNEQDTQRVWWFRALSQGISQMLAKGRPYGSQLGALATKSRELLENKDAQFLPRLDLPPDTSDHELLSLLPGELDVEERKIKTRFDNGALVPIKKLYRQRGDAGPIICVDRGSMQQIALGAPWTETVEVWVAAYRLDAD